MVWALQVSNLGPKKRLRPTPVPLPRPATFSPQLLVGVDELDDDAFGGARAGAESW